MEPNRVEFQKQCTFQSFCKRVLHKEACNAHEEIRRRRAKEVSFSDLALHEERQLYIQNGNRRLIADAAIWDWYHRAKTTAKPPARQGG